jgi:spermidine synthase
MKTRIRTLFTLFAVSGFCGLIYESIWSHYLKLFLGHAAYAQTVVLVVFIGGLALGSWLAGHFAARIRRPLIAYAAAEFAVGVSALLFNRIFISATDWAYASLLPAVCSAESWCWAQWIFAGILILPQSVLLGTTFPLMSGGILRLDPSLPGGKLALLYFLNSIGAVVGVLASGYVLIPTVGLPGALFTAGIFNVLLAIVVYGVDKYTQPAARLEPAAAPAGAAASSAPMLLTIAFLTGLSSFIYEIVWVRSLSMVLGSTTHSFELMLASFILGLALGGLWIRSRIDRLGDTLRFLAIVQVVMGVLAVSTLPVYDASFDFMAWMLGAVQRSEGGWVIFNLTSAFICLLVMLPATFMAGMTLPLITLTLLGSPMGEKSIGHVYAANTVGGIVGVIIAVHLGLPLLGLKGALILGGAIDVALGIFLLARAAGSAPRPRIAWSAGGVAFLLVAALFFHLDPLKLASGVYTFGRAQLRSSEIVYHRDGKTASVDVFQFSPMSLLSIATNGKVDGAITLRPEEKGPGPDEYTMTLLGGLGFVHKPDARTFAVIGFGTGMSTATILAMPGVERVDTIEIEPAMVEGARNFNFRNQRAFSDPRSHIVFDDAKSYFARSGRRYDVIVSEPSNPWVSGVASLFTREFYARVRGQLNSGGVLVQWLHTYSFSEGLLASVVGAMQQSFPHLALYAANNGDLVVVAATSPGSMAMHYDVFAVPAMKAIFDHVEIRRPEDLLLRRVADERLLDAMLRGAASPANSDYFPIVDTHAGKLNFLGVTAKQVGDISTAPWPIIEMTGGARLPPAYPITMAKWPTVGDRVREAQRAEAARAFLMGEKTREESHAGLENYYRPVTMFKLRFLDCQAGLAPEDIRDAMIATAGLVSVYLSPEAADAVWRRVQAAPCHRALDAETRDWITLLRAVARRDAAVMAEIAPRLLEAQAKPPLGELEYLYGAAMTALISLDRKDEARALLARYHARLPESRQHLGWFRWMRSAVASDATIAALAGHSP